MFGNKEQIKTLLELNEFTAVNTFSMLLINIDSDDKVQRKSLEPYYNYLRDSIHSERVLQILDNNWMRWIGSLPIDRQSLDYDKHDLRGVKS